MFSMRSRCTRSCRRRLVVARFRRACGADGCCGVCNPYQPRLRSPAPKREIRHAPPTSQDPGLHACCSVHIFCVDVPGSCHYSERRSVHELLRARSWRESCVRNHGSNECSAAWPPSHWRPQRCGVHRCRCDQRLRRVVLANSGRMHRACADGCRAGNGTRAAS